MSLVTSAAPEQTSAEPAKTFSESLLVVSKGFLESSSGSNDSAKTATRQQHNAEDMKAPQDLQEGDTPSEPVHRDLMSLPQQGFMMHPMPSAVPVAASRQRSFIATTEIAATPSGDSNEMASCLSEGVVPAKHSKVESVNSDSGEVQSKVRQSSHAVPTDNPPQESSKVSPSTNQSPTLPTAHSATVWNVDSEVAATAGVIVGVKDGSSSAMQVALPTFAPKAVSSGIPIVALNSSPMKTPKLDAETVLDSARGITASSMVNSSQIQVPDDSLSKSSNESISSVLSAEKSLPTAGAPSPHTSMNLSTREDTAMSSGPVTADSPATTPSATSDSEIGNDLTLSFGAAEVVVNQVHANGDVPGTGDGSLPGQISAAGSKPPLTPSRTTADGDMDTATKTTGLKTAPSKPQQSSAQSVSQAATSSSDPNQGSSSSQGQNAAVSQGNLVSHAGDMTTHAQSATIASTTQVTSTSAADAGHAAKQMESSSPALVAAQPAPPVINTAKLIQTMGQSEMRVGMRSVEFGNISISTSSTRELISAQISLEHGELARTLAAHLPEVQQKLGTNQALDMRIDLNGQGIGTSSGMSNGSAQESQGGRRQSRDEASSYSGGVAEKEPSRNDVAITTGVSRIDARLDIRV